MNSTDRTRWIDLRVTELMIDSDKTVEIIEDIQAHGGLANHGLCAALRRMMDSTTLAAEAKALHDAQMIVQAFAYLRACHEWDARHVH